MLNAVKCRTAVLVAATLFCTNVLAQLPVIPGAAGFGMDTPAGRGGKIIRVTNLNASGSGSLRNCVEASGPRICIFEVSGTIRLNTNLTISNPNMTIAGQTAPAPGIMLRGGALSIKASDVLVQHLAIRVGDDPDGPPSNARDTLKIETPSPIWNVIVDHCSISWSIDENISTYKSWDNVTISNSIVSEPLNDSLHPSGPHAYGALIDTTNDNSKISFIGNLFAHSDLRNPMTGAASFVFANNVVYNTGGAGVMLYSDNGITSDNSIVGNVFIEGPNTRSAGPLRIVGSTFGHEIVAGTRVYLADNLLSTSTADLWSLVDNQSLIDVSLLQVSSAPVWPEGLEALPTENGITLEHVLNNAGSRPGQRNSVDARVVTDVKKGTGRIINCVADDGTTRCEKNAGGWPKLAANVRALHVPSDPNGDDDSDGYTNMEEWLHAMAAEVEGRDSSFEPMNVAPPKPPELQD